MLQQLQQTMKAAAIDRFGGLELIALHTLPVPEVGPDEVLIRVETAGVAQWDPLEREGAFADRSEGQPRFPYVLGSDGAGTVAAAGRQASRFREGDRVYVAAALVNPKGGFYAQYAVVKADNVSHIPGKLPVEQAGVMGSDALMALQGLELLGLKPGETLMIFGASGGIGHLAVQLAKRLGVRILAAASGDDGVALARRLGADVVVDGRRGDVAAVAREFAPSGLDAALVTAGGEAADQALEALRAGGRAVHPYGLMPEPKAPPGVRLSGYEVEPGQEPMDKLNRLIEAGPFEVQVTRVFSLDQAAEAHRALAAHYLGKLALSPG